MLSTAIVDRASGPWIPAALGTRLGPQRRQGVRPRAPGTRAGGSAAARPPRPHKSASPTQSHLPRPWQQQQRAPWQQPAPPRPRRGCGEGVRPSRGARSRPPAAPRPSSRPALPSHLPRACPSGLCCWLLLLAAGCWCCWRPPRPAGGNLWPSRTIFAVSHPLMAPGWGRGHSLGQSGRSWVHGHHLPHLPTCPPPPPTLPPPTFWASRYAAVERVAPDVRALLCENYA